uniref:Uncharacterized protein n=1 Tax=Anguilla anguilla TaxID=7936 RepID=A0A0E9QRH8_ANGAN
MRIRIVLGSGRLLHFSSTFSPVVLSALFQSSEFGGPFQ